MSAPLSPAELLEKARELCWRADDATAGLWPRAAALLARQALEDALDRYWAATKWEDISKCPTATQLACLWQLADRELAELVSSTWAALSSACHIHPYELAPTASELLSWVQAVEGFCNDWGGAGGTEARAKDGLS